MPAQKRASAAQSWRLWKMPEVCPFQGENIGPDWELGEEETPIFLFVGF